MASSLHFSLVFQLLLNLPLGGLQLQGCLFLGPRPGETPWPVSEGTLRYATFSSQSYASKPHATQPQGPPVLPHLLSLTSQWLKWEPSVHVGTHGHVAGVNPFLPRLTAGSTARCRVLLPLTGLWAFGWCCLLGLSGIMAVDTGVSVFDTLASVPSSGTPGSLGNGCFP